MYPRSIHNASFFSIWKYLHQRGYALIFGSCVFCYTQCMNIFFDHDLDAVSQQQLQTAFGSDVYIGRSDELAQNSAKGRSSPCFLISGRPKREMLASASNLNAVIVPWAGPPKETVELMSEFPSLPLYNIHHNAAPVAEMALGLLLAAARCIAPRDRDLREGNWSRHIASPSTILDGKTALLLGYGAIGRRLEPVLTALGMKVRIVRRSQPEFAMENQRQVGDLHQELPICDVLICSLPLTQETRGLMGERELGRMKSTAIVVNVGRGGVFDQEALYNALLTQKIQAAGLDVWYNYPDDDERNTIRYPSDYPFWNLDQVVLSPHIAGEYKNPEIQYRRIAALIELIQKIVKGAAPKAFDIQRGY